MPSIFTKIVKGEIPSYKIDENEHFYAFLDINPMAKGHTLVVPKNETDYIFDIEDAKLAEMVIFAKKIGLAIEKAIPCKRIGLMVVGLEVPHAHIHLIPINKESDMNLSRVKLKLGTQDFESIAARIRSELKFYTIA